MRVTVLLALDLGNTRLHAGLVRDGAVEAAAAAPAEDARALERLDPDFLRALRASAPAAAAFVSVRPAADRALRESVRRLFGLAAVQLGVDRPVPVANRTDRPEQVGADRLVNALASYARAKGACVAASFGTAVTVDAVASDGAFLGGAILPGLRIQARALHDHCARLPDIGEEGLLTCQGTATPGPPAIGRTTLEAIRSGLVRGLAGAVRSLVDAARRELATAVCSEARSEAECLRKVPLILTGGDAPLVRELLGEGEVVPHLALEGIARAYGLD
jgi:type III pantothenate kinase